MGESDIFVFKRKIGASEINYVMSDEVKWPASTLIDRAISLGTVNERGPGITVHTLQHSGGVMMVFVNLTPDKKLTEEVGF